MDRHDPATGPEGHKTDVIPTARPARAVSIDEWSPGAEGLGHFDVLETLGRGGCGVVVRAFDRKLRRAVAIKVMTAEMAATSPARRRFVREARAAAAVRHENVVQIYAVEEDATPWLVMEYVPGTSLQQYLTQNGPLAVALLLRIGAQIARGLAAAHDCALVHRDVKPGNILIEWSDDLPRVKLTDFGIARAADDASLTQSGMIVGTPMYMSPEQARGEAVDRRSDLYSLGSVLYEMAAGHPPFRAANSLAVVQRVAEEEPRPLREVIPETPAWLCALIAKLQAKKPRDRFQTAREVAGQLERHLADLDRARSDREGAVPPPPYRRPLRWLAAAALLAACVSVVAFGGPFDPFDPFAPARDTAPAPTATAPLPVPTPTVGPAPAVAEAPVVTAERLCEEVAAEIRRLNPKFKGRSVPTVAEGRVVGWKLEGGAGVADLAPLARLRDLQRLVARHGDFTDLGPLRGLPLRYLDLTNSGSVGDLSPLEGMPLETLFIWGFMGDDLSPLRGMPMKSLHVGYCSKRLDLAPLRGMPLTTLGLNSTLVDDLTPLKGMPLEMLSLRCTRVSDLSPLAGMKLRSLHVGQTLVTDLSPIRGLPLEQINLDFDAKRDGELIRSIPTLERINNRPAGEFLAKEVGD